MGIAILLGYVRSYVFIIGRSFSKLKARTTDRIIGGKPEKSVGQVEAIDGRRAKGDASRRKALAHAVDIALIDGLEGLSFGRVAADAGMAKSSLQILFGDRLSLQLQTLENGIQRFANDVANRVRRMPDHAAHPLRSLCDAWFSISWAPGCSGCLLTFSVAEFSVRSGPVSEAVKHALDRWSAALKAAADQGVRCGELSAGTDIDQLVFEILAFQSAANNRIAVADQSALERAQKAVHERLARAVTP